MSVGGKVVETIDLPERGRVWVNTQEQVWNPRTNAFDPRDLCAIYIERNADAQQVAVGDSLWWQGGEAYWTPRGATFEDRPIPRIGYSGVPRPGEASDAT